MPNISAKFV